MEALGVNYKNHLDQLKTAIQQSELLELYLESESEELYKQMIEAFESHIAELYKMVADKHPLQLISLEKELLDPGFEGLFLPRILGYSVLRGEIDSNYKYKRPQDHFKNILNTICGSANFDFIKMRIGQTVQIGFALSSDIWLTNLMDHLTNKKVKSFLNVQKVDKFRDLQQRKIGYENYKKQFHQQNFLTADFPKNISELKIFGSSLIAFLEYRANWKFNNENILPHIDALISNESLHTDPDFLEIIMITGMFYDVSDASRKTISGIFDKLRKEEENFSNKYFQRLLHLYRSNVEITPDADKRMSKIINKKINDGVSSYYNLMDVVHTKGYVHEDTISAVKDYYDQHKGLSIENECLREGIFGYCESFLNNLDTDSYHEYFEINKVFTSYINTFYNQKFNQNIKDLSLKYIHRLMEVYIDKRGRDYQDIKKFVTSTFLDLGLKTEKDLAEMFKTKKK
ncbi:MAG: hypothetical protein KA270_16355 [Saprospiraceae bacterium]|jgi:hypothetical protein|nr:hypothetical protein [Saprospiraceae bacterium]MBP6568746.1 hypothetical protein [Saprospiraceae bacterium]MBP9196476.1 hypothetical protein [Saprospiraceae bacterium]